LVIRDPARQPPTVSSSPMPRAAPGAWSWRTLRRGDGGAGCGRGHVRDSVAAVAGGRADRAPLARRGHASAAGRRAGPPATPRCPPP